MPRMEHPDEHTLELYVLDPDGLAAKDRLATHLAACRGCAALYQEIEAYHRDVGLLRNARRQADEFAGQIVPAVSGKVRVSGPLRPSLPARVAGFAFRHPVQTTSGILLATALAIVSFVQTSSESASYAQAQDGFLVAYSGSGSELWRNRQGPGFSEEQMQASELETMDDENSFLAVTDVDGDGIKEVLAALGAIDESSSEIVCYDGDGSERWRFSLGRPVSFAGTEYTDDFLAVFVRAGDFDADGRFEVIAYARHRTYFPSVVVKLNGADGRLESEYWHSGWFTSAAKRDVNGDGVPEFLFGGQNNSFNLASLVVLDPRSIVGSSPAEKTLSFDDMEPGCELLYMLLPRTELSNLTSKPRNNVSVVHFSKDSLLQLAVTESLFGGMENSAYLFFDFNFRCVRVGPSDDFAMAYELAKRGGNKMVSVDEMYDRVKSGIRYWNGSTFDSAPVFRSYHASRVPQNAP